MNEDGSIRLTGFSVLIQLLEVVEMSCIPWLPRVVLRCTLPFQNFSGGSMGGYQFSFDRFGLQFAAVKAFLVFPIET